MSVVLNITKNAFILIKLYHTCQDEIVYLWILNVYFLTNLSNLTLVTIRGDGVEILDPYKYLGGQQTAVVRQYRGPLSEMAEQDVLFNVCTRLLQMFSHSVLTSIIFFAVVCWEGGRLHLWCQAGEKGQCGRSE